MLRYISILFFISIIWACTSNNAKTKIEEKEVILDEASAEYWIQKTLNYHDSMRAFNNSEIKARISSTTIRDTTERKREVLLNPAEKTFLMRQKTDSIDIVYQLPIPAEEKDSVKIKRSNMYQNYFRYMLGGALVLGDKAAILKETVKDTVLLDRPAKYIAVQYEPIGETPNWYFTIDALSGEMLQSRFVYNEGKEDQRGEFINYGPYVDYKGMRLTTQLNWFYLNGDTLASERISYY